MRSLLTYLLVQVGHASNVKVTLNNMQEQVAFLWPYFVFSATHPHALYSDNFLDEKQEIITTLTLS